MKVLRTRRWIAAHIAIAVVVATFVNLGFWQLRRLDERRAFNDRLLSRRAQPVAAPDQLIPLGGGADPAAAYRRVRATGRYDLANERVLMSQSYRGISGHHVVTPLLLADGRALLVDRGWVPIEAHTPPVARARPPEGVEVTGVLVPTQTRRRLGPPDSPPDRPDQMFRIDIARLEKMLPYSVYPYWLMLERQTPPQTGRLPRPVSLPPLDEGSHLSYAIQWFAFTIVALAWYVVMARAAVKGRTTRALPFEEEIANPRRTGG